jgi:predicted phage tail protein
MKNLGAFSILCGLIVTAATLFEVTTEGGTSPIMLAMGPMFLVGGICELIRARKHPPRV